jgi:hypothetical protein
MSWHRNAWPSRMLCRLTGLVMHEPVVAAHDGCVYERAVIKAAMPTVALVALPWLKEDIDARKRHMFTRMMGLPAAVLWWIWGEFLAFDEYTRRVLVLCTGGAHFAACLRGAFAECNQAVVPRPPHMNGGDSAENVKLRAASGRLWARRMHETRSHAASVKVTATLKGLSRTPGGLKRMYGVLQRAEREMAQERARRVKQARSNARLPRGTYPALILSDT